MSAAVPSPAPRKRLFAIAEIEAEGARRFAHVKPGAEATRRCAELLSAALQQAQETGSEEHEPVA